MKRVSKRVVMGEACVGLAAGCSWRERWVSSKESWGSNWSSACEHGYVNDVSMSSLNSHSGEVAGSAAGSCVMVERELEDVAEEDA